MSDEYDEARKTDEHMIKVLDRANLTDYQRLNYLRTVEISAKLLHTSLVDRMLRENKQ